MNILTNFISDARDVLMVQFSTFGVMDVIDLLVVAFIMYKVIGFIRDTRAVQLVRGILLLVLLYLLSSLLGMNTVNFVLSNTLQLGLIAVLIIFQPELRRALERVGRSKFGMRTFGVETEEGRRRAEEMIDAVCRACTEMAKSYTGALIVFERKVRLGEVVKSGTEIRSEITPELLGTIFYSGTPLHDGAVVIRDLHVEAAGCFLPLTGKDDLSKELGTRHRAAIGITETSDAYVVVVSEETGTISTVENGVITRNFKEETLREDIRRNLLGEEKRRRRLWKRGGGKR